MPDLLQAGGKIASHTMTLLLLSGASAAAAYTFQVERLVQQPLTTVSSQVPSASTQPTQIMPVTPSPIEPTTLVENASANPETPEAVPELPDAVETHRLSLVPPLEIKPDSMQGSLSMLKSDPRLSLAQAVQQAVDWHPSIRTSINKLFESDEQINNAKAGYYPQIRGGVSTEYNNQENNRFDSRYIHALSVSATQMLYDFGKVSSAVDRAQAGRMAASAQVLLSVDQLARDTANAVIEVQRYRQLLDIAQEQITGVRDIAALARHRSELGASSLSDEVQARARVESAIASKTQLDTQVARWEASLRYLTGMSSVPELAPIGEAELGLGCAGELPSTDLSPAVMIAEAEKRQAQALLEQASAEQLPTLSLEGNLRRPLNETVQSGRRNEASFMLNVAAPFYQGGSIMAQKRGAQNALAAAESAVAQARLSATQGLLESQSQIAGYAERMRSLGDRVSSMAQTRDLYRDQYLSLGTRSLLDLLNAEQEYHQARLDRINNVHDMQRLQIECLYHAGKLRAFFGLDGKTIAGVEILP